MSVFDDIHGVQVRLGALEQEFYGSQLQTKNAIATSRKMNQRVEQQDEGINNLQIAICVSTVDPLGRGGIRFYTPLMNDNDDTVEQLPFAYPISSMGGFDDSGSIWVPPAGSRVAIIFQNGDRNAAYYLGTIWDGHRGADGKHLDFWDYANMTEYQCLWDGRRNGYNIGDNTGDQVYPQWNTEMYNRYDNDSIVNFYSNPSQFATQTYPYIYGFKTPGKHGLKFVDGDHSCNNRWARSEWRSITNNIIVMKDDHLHPCGQWAFGSSPDLSQCQTNGVPNENPCCSDSDMMPMACVDVSCIGQSGTDDDCSSLSGMTNSSVDQTDTLANPYYKRTEEQLFYEGVSTPMQNKCELPQSGVQIQSVSGHQFVMDDSVDQPTGLPIWSRTFDFGCNDIYKGKTFWRSCTGHQITLDDSEETRRMRGQTNGIFLETATGVTLGLCDETIQEGDSCDSPPNYAGPQRGLTAQTTSNHLFQMIDSKVHQAAEPRMNGGEPKLEDQNGYEGYILLRSGYGLQLMMKDQDIQTETNQQFIQLLSPQKTNTERGPHQLLMQETPDGPGLVLLRAGGVYNLVTYDDSIETVGDDDDNPSNKMCHVSNNYVIDVKNYYYNHNELTVMFAEEYIYLFAGRDCPAPSSGNVSSSTGSDAGAASNAQVSAVNAGEQPQPGTSNAGPCIFPVIVAQDPWKCPLTGYVHFGFMNDGGTTLDSRSERVFASGRKNPMGSMPEQPPPQTDYPPPQTDQYTTAGGNPPQGGAGGNPAVLPDTVGQNGEATIPTTNDNQVSNFPFKEASIGE